MTNYPIQLSAQLSQHLRSFRQHRKLTQQQLAQSLGLTQSRIADIEADPGKVSVENLLKILSALKVQLVLEDQQDQQDWQDPSALGIAELIGRSPTQAENTLPQAAGLELLQASKKKPHGGSW
ncbi:helix-turn-helix domain-containing protein [Polynucleobacter paneuropaeus]|jgi:HTH-type transcriptional regulator/antitoxin HipB|nr:helix-turn-helix domain-containing protein [Polynucleobacter paneuropaeus]QWD32262.1 helix-turn-helix domain-containing protein [Polynucleobacter paneuropaeus]